MEDTLGAFEIYVIESATNFVLILVLMEDTLGVCSISMAAIGGWGLNPCFNGRYSRRFVKK